MICEETKMNDKKLYVLVNEKEYELLAKYIDDDYIFTGCGYSWIFKSLKDIPRDTHIINVGFCGSNNLPIGTVCNINKCYHYRKYFTDQVEDVYTLPVLSEENNYPCYSSDDFVLETDITEPVVFDMELYAILTMGFTNVSAIKIVSDNLCLDDYRDIYQDK